MFAILVEARHLPATKQSFECPANGQDSGSCIRDTLTIKFDLDLWGVEAEVTIKIDDAGIFLGLFHDLIHIFFKLGIAFGGLDHKFDGLASRALPERAGIIAKGANPRNFRELRLQFTEYFILGAAAFFPRREL